MAVTCWHQFEVKKQGLVCKSCGYTLHLIKTSKGKISSAYGQNTPVQNKTI